MGREYYILPTLQNMVMYKHLQLLLSTRRIYEFLFMLQELFAFKCIKRRARQDAIIERPRQRRRINEGTARRVDQIRAAFELRERFFIDHMIGRWNSRSMQRHNIGLGQQLIQGNIAEAKYL